MDLDALLAEPEARRKKWLEAQADRTITDTVAKGVEEAATLEDLHAAVSQIVELHATPDLAPPEP